MDNRRNFLKKTVLSAGAMSMFSFPSLADSGRKKVQLGIISNTLQNEFKTDYRKALHDIAEIGFTHLESSVPDAANSAAEFKKALDAAGEMYGREDLKQEASAIRETISKQAFNGEFFVDNAVRNEQRELIVTENTSEICQYFAFYFDIASPESHPELWDKLVNDFGPDRIYENPYPRVYMGNKFKGNYFRLELLSRYNLRSQLLDESIDFFDYQAAQTGTLWANLGIDDQFKFFDYLVKPNSNPWEDMLTSQNLNHGYTSHIVHVLYKDVLGITDIDINAKKISFRIPDIDLSFCKGAISLGDEIIEFEWNKEGETVMVKYSVPNCFEIDIQNDTKYNINL